MKKAFAILFIAVLLVACGPAEISAVKTERFTERDRYLTVTQDTLTGCKYIIYTQSGGYAGFGGITPLMLPDGTQDCEN